MKRLSALLPLAQFFVLTALILAGLNAALPRHALAVVCADGTQTPDDIAESPDQWCTNNGHGGFGTSLYGSDPTKIYLIGTAPTDCNSGTLNTNPQFTQPGFTHPYYCIYFGANSPKNYIPAQNGTCPAPSGGGARGSVAYLKFDISYPAATTLCLPVGAQDPTFVFVNSKNGPDAGNTGGVGGGSGSITLGGDGKCGSGAAGSEGSCIGDDIKTIINFLAAGVGVVIVVMVLIAGFQYLSARDNPQAVQGAKNKLLNAIIALASFIFLYAFLQWISPGKIFG